MWSERFGKRFTTAATPDSLGRFHRIYQLRGNTGFNTKSTRSAKRIIVINTLQIMPLNVCARSFTQGQRIPKNETPTVFSR